MQQPAFSPVPRGSYGLSARDREMFGRVILFTERFFPVLGLLEAKPVSDPCPLLLRAWSVCEHGLVGAFARQTGDVRPALMQELLCYCRVHYRTLERSKLINGRLYRPPVIAGGGAVLDPCAIMTRHDEIPPPEQLYSFYECGGDQQWCHPMVCEGPRGMVLTAVPRRSIPALSGALFLGVRERSS